MPRHLWQSLSCVGVASSVDSVPQLPWSGATNEPPELKRSSAIGDPKSFATESLHDRTWEGSPTRRRYEKARSDAGFTRLVLLSKT
jgi:hypothetical protein